MRKNTISDFWKRVNKSGPLVLDTRCWVWSSPDIQSGYGRIVIGGVTYTSHRYSWQLANGDPGNLFVLHKCDNKLCVNPSHLFLGTTQDNRADCVRKCRQAKGVGHGRAVLNDDKVREIRRRYRKGDSRNGCKPLAMEFGVGQFTVYKIVRRIDWRHVK